VRAPVHSVDRIYLKCRTHKQHGAKKMYGRAVMERARAAAKVVRSRKKAATRPERSKRPKDRPDPLLL
jgi:hypothetical protein